MSPAIERLVGVAQARAHLETGMRSGLAQRDDLTRAGVNRVLARMRPEIDTTIGHVTLSSGADFHIEAHAAIFSLLQREAVLIVHLMLAYAEIEAMKPSFED